MNVTQGGPDAPQGPLLTAGDDDATGESRWPMAIAVFATVILASVPPARFTIGPLPLFPVVVSVLLVVLVLGDPRADRSALSVASERLVSARWGARDRDPGGNCGPRDRARAGSPAVSEAGPLLIYAAKVWVGNNVAFALLYWNLDRGGPAERVHGTTRYPDFVFPQMSDPSLAGPGWRPRFIDYLYVGFTNANAFSPTDTLPLTGRAKLAMQTQALISFTLLTLALARVVNVFT